MWGVYSTAMETEENGRLHPDAIRETIVGVVTGVFISLILYGLLLVLIALAKYACTPSRHD